MNQETIYSKIHEEIIADLKGLVLTEYCGKGCSTEIIRKFMYTHINNSRAKVNVNALDIHFVVASGPGQIIPNDIRVVAGNLYTYITLCGIEVPYYDWIYDEKFVYDGYLFKYNGTKHEYYHLQHIKQKK